jgi:trigger factor
MTIKDIKNLDKKDISEKKVKISGEISAELVSEGFTKSLSKIKRDFQTDGFRKGAVPENIILSKLGEMTILQDCAEDLLNDSYPLILDEFKLDVVGRPEINITKIAKDNPLGFDMVFYLRPEVKLPDYKKIAKDLNSKPQEEMSVTEDEVSAVIKELREQVAHMNLHQKSGLKEHDHNHGEIKEEDLPEVDDNFIKLFGPYKNVDEFKERLKENIKADKEVKYKDKRKTELLEGILKETSVSMPEVIVLAELDKIEAQFKDDLLHSGLSFEKYLEHIKKTEDEVKESWKPLAKTRAETQIMLNEIAKIESIEPKEEDIKREVDHITESVKGADRFRARMYVENFLTNDLVIKFLESVA